MMRTTGGSGKYRAPSWPGVILRSSFPSGIVHRRITLSSLASVCLHIRISSSGGFSLVAMLISVQWGTDQMRLYAVSYDVHEDRNYQLLIEGLRKVGAVKLLESLWLIAVNDGAGDVTDWMRSLANKDDPVVVIELKPGSSWSSVGAKRDGTAWLTRNIRAGRISLRGR